MKRYRIAVYLGLVVAVPVISGCGGAAQGGGSTNPSDVVSMNASWVAVYSSIDELKENSDLAVSGFVTGQTTAVAADGGPPLTSFTLDVEEAIWAREGQEFPDQLTIDQSGGIVDGVKWEIHDDPLFNAGEHAVLFVEQFEAGEYRVIGGPSGRYVIEEGMVTGLAGSSSRIAGSSSYDEFVENVRR